MSFFKKAEVKTTEPTKVLDLQIDVTEMLKLFQSDKKIYDGAVEFFGTPAEHFVMQLANNMADGIWEKHQDVLVDCLDFDKLDDLLKTMVMKKIIKKIVDEP